MRRDGQPELAREIHHELRGVLQCEYDDGGSIGRRYRRQDEIGTPWCLTVDHQSARGPHGDAARSRHARAGADRDRRARRRARTAPRRTVANAQTGLSRRQSQLGGSGTAPRRRRDSHQPLRRGAASPMPGSPRSAVATAPSADADAATPFSADAGALEGSLTPTARSVVPAVASSAPSGGAVSAPSLHQRRAAARCPQPSPHQRRAAARCPQPSPQQRRAAARRPQPSPQQRRAAARCPQPSPQRHRAAARCPQR